MGRSTRSSNGGSKVGSYQHNSSGNRNTLIASSAKRGQVKEDSGISVRRQPPTESTLFDFPKEVPFDYTPRQNGFGTVLEFMKRGDESVKDKILNECNFIVECRVCNNLFRSPRDFVTHKDKHCSEKYQRMSPAGLAELLRLAQDSFKVNIETVAPNSTTSVLPTVCDTRDDGDLSFDVNRLIPMMSLALNRNQNLSQVSSSHLNPKELELLTNTANHAADGVVRTTRQLPRGRHGELQVKGKYKSKPKDNAAAVLGADGKAVVVGKSTSIQDIVAQLTAQWEIKKNEEDTKESILKCSTCQMLCPSEKALRIHARRDHKQISEKAKKRKMTEVINGISKEVQVMLIGESTNAKSKRQATSKKLKLSPSGDTKTEKSEASNSRKTRLRKKNSMEGRAAEIKTPARVLSFRRLTNNSFSATFGNNSESDPMLSLNAAELIVSLPKRSRKANVPDIGDGTLSRVKGEESSPDYKAIAKALFTRTSRKGKKGGRKKKSTTSITSSLPSESQSSWEIVCLKCTAKFPTEKDMYIHLGNCSSQNITQRISILERQDYMKLPNSLEEPLPPKSQTSTPSFNNNENEVEAEEAERRSMTKVKLENEISNPCSCPLEDTHFMTVVTPSSWIPKCEIDTSLLTHQSEKVEDPITVTVTPKQPESPHLDKYKH